MCVLSVRSQQNICLKCDSACTECVAWVKFDIFSPVCVILHDERATIYRYRYTGRELSHFSQWKMCSGVQQCWSISDINIQRVAKQTQISDNIAGCLLDVLRVSFSAFIYPRVFRCVCCSHVKVENIIWRLWPKHWMALDLIQDGRYSFMNEIQRLSGGGFWEMNREWYERIRIRMKRRILLMFYPGLHHHDRQTGRRN